VTPVQIGILGCIVMLLLLMSSMPVAFVMATVGLIGFGLLVNPHAALSMITADLYETTSSYSLTVIPLFVFMGRSRSTRG